LRPLVDDDRGRLVDAFYRLSEKSRYRRFFAPVRDLSEETLDYLVEIDHHDHEAIVALDSESGDLIGVARYVRQAPGSERAEAAVVVADDWQGQGLGRALLERLASRARQEGILRFTALVQADNRRALELLSQIGPTSRGFEGSVVELDIELPPEPLGASLTAALRAAAASTLGVWPLSERISRFARELRESRAHPARITQAGGRRARRD
jgi:GNAT superfamily N-acetyltransferase